jgi:hypothetical protein
MLANRGWRCLPYAAVAIFAVVAVGCGFGAAAEPAGPAALAKPTAAAPADLKARRREAAWRKRRVIMNNDGNDVFGLATDRQDIHEAFLEARTAPLVGSQVDAIFYCTGVFNQYSHASDETELQENGDKGVPTAAKALVASGRDSLATVVEFAHRHGLEAWWSMRMNDTHDSSDETIFSAWKRAHPDWLMARKGERMPYGGGRWSAVDYGREEVREKVFRIVMDVARRYDVDGIELDFFRHPLYFKSQVRGEPVSREQCDAMTQLLARIRRGVDEVAEARGRPLLIAVRVMNAPRYARGIGLDVEAWLEKGLVDVLVAGGCYFHIEPWQTMVGLGHGHDVPVYACLSESRLPIEDLAVWRGGALEAWEAGVDGIYTFNLFDPGHRLFRELGDPSLLKTLPVDRRSPRGSPYWINFLKDGDTYGSLPAN